MTDFRDRSLSPQPKVDWCLAKVRHNVTVGMETVTVTLPCGSFRFSFLAAFYVGELMGNEKEPGHACMPARTLTHTRTRTHACARVRIH